ncbi:DUF975 family protein [Bacillus sp. CECT 9360]|uniref:DUF975 family protein n=1 Tax=Bacillus sp. CECT 9360 TaxID=2845821 RepID=UPI001E2ED42E|nr:DUF975 family protein [Bacillus sp. CECT 9360]CAH0345437.1 hypothetical protein BCI9360_01723 [Bacillus sp. CECT 9360]
MTISEIKKHALTSLKGQWGKAVLLTFLVFFITTVLTLIVEVSLSGGFTNWLYQEETPIAADLINLLISLALMPLSIASYWFYLNLSRQENAQISQVFAIFKKAGTYFKVIGTSLLVVIFVILWSLLLIVPGIIKSISYSQAFFLMKDHPEYSALEAITESKKRMKGYKGKYFLMYLSFIGWGILSMITLGIGLLWLVPYMTTSMAAFYDKLIYKQNSVEEEEPVI